MTRMENNRFISYLRLTRIHSAVLTGLAPVCTAVAMMEPLPLVHYFALFIIGLFFHIYLFVCNEICDIRIDKELASLKQKPLVEKTVSLTDAKKIVLVSIIGVFLGAILVFPDKIIFQYVKLAFLLASLGIKLNSLFIGHLKIICHYSTVHTSLSGK